MKTITVTDEVYDFLKSCQQELNTQDNRSTANPIFGFIVKEVVSSINEDKWFYINEDHTDKIADSEQEDHLAIIAKYILERYDYDITKINKELKEDYEDPIKFRKQKEDEQDDDYFRYLEGRILWYLEDRKYSNESILRTLGITIYYYDKIDKMYEDSVSLFESDMQAHLDMNKHNMKDYRTYVYSNHRTPKMTQLRDILMKEIIFE